MTFLKQRDFESMKSKKSLEMLVVDRDHEFRELASVLQIPNTVKNWEEFILNICLEVDSIFKKWSGQEALEPLSNLKSMNIMRQLSHNKKTMIEVTHMLNLSYTIANEFKEIYSRL